MAQLRLRLTKLSGHKWKVSIHHPDGRAIVVGEVKAKTKQEAQTKAIKLNQKKNFASPLEKATFGKPPRGMPGRWWRRPLPRGGRSCYRTKADALKVFADENFAVIEEYGGIDYNVSTQEFDSINHKYGTEATNIAEALWAAVPPTRGRQVCLEDIDLDALNDTSPARNARETIGLEFQLPSSIMVDKWAAQEEEYYRRQLGGAMRKKGTHLKTTSTRGWAKASPDKVTERRRIMDRCGRGAFLLIDKTKTGKSKPEFPIVAKGGGCSPDCRGLWAAKQRAAQTGRRSIEKRATQIAKGAGCRWAKDE
jgi:hypothetical protein